MSVRQPTGDVNHARVQRRAVGLLLGVTVAVTLLIGSLLMAGVVRAANPILVGTVGLHNAYKINLTFPSGRKVRSIRAGTYTLVVHDYSAIHNFALGSQTENKRLLTTGIPWRGTKRYTLRFTPGSYAYACSAHFRTMNGTFTVTP